MSSVTRPRGPLPPGVYWRRRALLLGAALVLVFAFARVLGGGSDAKSDSDGTAEQAAGSTSSDASTTSTPSGPTKKPTKKGPKATPKNTPTRNTPTRAPLAEPDGPCDDDDVEVTPTIKRPIAGSPIKVGLELRTKKSEACTWSASKDSLVVKITSGSDDIWSTQDCPNAVMAKDVVVRRAVATTVYAIWSSRRSDDECGKRTAWADLGWYHVTAAALGGEPTDVQFELRAPQPPTIPPSPTATKNPSKSASQPTDEPNPNPSDGAQEPNG